MKLGRSIQLGILSLGLALVSSGCGKKEDERSTQKGAGPAPVTVQGQQTPTLPMGGESSPSVSNSEVAKAPEAAHVSDSPADAPNSASASTSSEGFFDFLNIFGSHESAPDPAATPDTAKVIEKAAEPVVVIAPPVTQAPPSTNVPVTAAVSAPVVSAPAISAPAPSLQITPPPTSSFVLPPVALKPMASSPLAPSAGTTNAPAAGFAFASSPAVKFSTDQSSDAKVSVLPITENQFSRMVPGAAESIGLMIVDDPRKGMSSASYVMHKKDFLGSMIGQVEGEPTREYKAYDVQAALAVLAFSAALDETADAARKFESVPLYRLAHVIRRFIADNATDPRDAIDQEGLYQKVLKKWKDGCDARPDEEKKLPCAFTYKFTECDWTDSVPDFTKPPVTQEYIQKTFYSYYEGYVRTTFQPWMEDRIAELEKKGSVKLGCSGYVLSQKGPFYAKRDLQWKEISARNHQADKAKWDADSLVEWRKAMRESLVQGLVKLEYKKRFYNWNGLVFTTIDNNSELRKHPWGEISFEVAEDRLPRSWDGFKDLLKERLDHEYHRRNRTQMLAGLESKELGPMGQFANAPWVQRFLQGQKARARVGKFGVFSIPLLGLKKTDVEEITAELKLEGEKLGPTHSGSEARMINVVNRLKARGIKIQIPAEGLIQELDAQYSPLFKIFVGTETDQVMFDKLFRREKANFYHNEPAGDEHRSFTTSQGSNQQVFVFLLSETNAQLVDLSLEHLDREELRRQADAFFGSEMSKQMLFKQLSRVHMTLSHPDPTFNSLRGKSEGEIHTLLQDGLMRRLSELEEFYMKGGYSAQTASQQAWDIVVGRAIDSPFRIRQSGLNAAEPLKPNRLQ